MECVVSCETIPQVNNVDFTNIIREEAVLFLLDLPKGEEVTILAQKKKDGEPRSDGAGSWQPGLLCSYHVPLKKKKNPKLGDR